MARIRKPKYTDAGTTKVSQNYAIRLLWRGKRIVWSLGTGNREVAAQVARDIYRSLNRHGYDETVKTFRRTPAATEDKVVITIGQFLDRVSATNSFKPRTWVQYSAALRRIAGDLAGFDDDPIRHACRGENRGVWAAKVDSLPLSTLTPSAIQSWKVSMLKANKSPNTTNRYLESAAALFAPETLKHIDTTIENPFKTVAKCKRPSSRFHSTFDFEALVQSALSELEGDTLAAFVLTAIGGMRKSEVDNLLWSSVDWNRNTVAVKHTHYWSPKSESSMRSVAFDPEFFAMFKGLHAKATTPFILSSPVQPRKEFPAGWYRASHTFNRLAAWLKAHGVNDRKPLHTMRKACGSVVNHRLGLFAASQFLGHSSTTITSRYYVEAKEVITSGFGHLVKPSENVVPMTTEEQQPTTESVAQ